MVLNAAVQMLREADELKQKILNYKSGTSMLQERSLWASQQQLQKIYQKVLVLDLDYALDKKVEQDLWNVGFKQQIEALQAIAKDKKNPLRSEGQAMLSWVLQAAAGFYLGLLHQICTAFKLDLPFRRRASLLGMVSGWKSGETGGVSAGGPRYVTQHCLVHLGDLARYRHQLRVAHTFYRHALLVSAHSGQPYNQLALVSCRRGRRLSAVYWQVRSLEVRAPFPPAPANLHTTLANAVKDSAKDLPVLPGITNTNQPRATTPPITRRLDSHAFVSEFLKALHLIHELEDLDTAAQLVNNLNTSLTALIATDSFESMTLIKITCILIWLVSSSSEVCESVESSGTLQERRGAGLSRALVAGTLAAALLPATAHTHPLPAIKIWLQYLVSQKWLMTSPQFASRPHIWPALAHMLNTLAEDNTGFNGHLYDTVPLPEDEELHGFLPLESAFAGLRFVEHATWEQYGDALPELEQLHDRQETADGVPPEVRLSSLSADPEVERKVRAYRLIQVGKQISELHPELLTVTSECVSGRVEFGSPLRPPPGPPCPPSPPVSPAPPAVPTPTTPVYVISEADFKEKVREKRVGILKPQGSLERAREERALASTQEETGSILELDESDECSKSEDRRDAARKTRMNVAMAAIMRKQEESNKQVKFITPPLTPDLTGDMTETSQKDDKPKIIQTKSIKSLANLPVGRKTGGILSLKDRSAGYPHLQNQPEPKKEEKETKKPTQEQTNWNNITQQNYTEQPRPNFQHKNSYGIQNVGMNYNPNYQVSNQGIRLPVVNPKEIDVRTAALQKQNSRQEYQDKFGQNHQMSSDKKNFLNDLPPRFANQYRYWNTSGQDQATQYNQENTFRDDKSLLGAQRPNWNQNPQENYQQPMPWWKPDNMNFNNYPPQMNLPSYYTPPITNLGNPYPNMNYQVQPNAHMQQNKPDLNTMPPNYMQSPLGQMGSIPNMVANPNFNSLPSYRFQPSVGYDSSMYPQFNKMGFQGMKIEKPMSHYPTDIGFGSNMMSDMRNPMMSFNEPMNRDGANGMEQTGMGEKSSMETPPGNTYSLFSGAADNTSWNTGFGQPQQSLWSGPGPSPLERLLEQQKQLKQAPPTEPQ